MSELKLITFDAMNTLLKTKHKIGFHYARTAKKCGFSVKARAIDPVFPSVFKSYWQTYPNFGHDHGISSTVWWKEVIRTTMINAGLHIEDHDFSRQSRFDFFLEQLFQSYKEKDCWQLQPGSSEVLLRYRMIYKLGIISNFDERLEMILSNLRIRNFFDTVVASREAGLYKPDSRIFDTALRRAGLSDPSQALHIGDNFELDYVAATNAGWNAIWLCDDPTKLDVFPARKDQVISSLAELHLNPFLNSLSLRSHPTTRVNLV